MKIKVYGKAHLEGVSKKTGKPYNFNQVHYLGKSRGVEGLAAMTLSLDPAVYPITTIMVNEEYNVEFDQHGYPIEFALCARRYLSFSQIPAALADDRKSAREALRHAASALRRKAGKK